MLEVDVFGDDLQRIAQCLDLALACLVGEQVELDGAAGARLAHEENCRACCCAMGNDGRFLEVPFIDSQPVVLHFGVETA